jgi:hypothetical protein
MPSKPKNVSVPVFPSVPGMEVSEYSVAYRPVEDEQERALRLHKERYIFWVRDIGTYAFGIFFLSMVALYCFWALFDRSTTPEERRYVWAAISAVMGGIVGTFFGRSMK